MRILLTCATPSFTGPAELMLDDADSLARAGHEVTLGFDTIRIDDLKAMAVTRGFHVAELGLCRTSGPVQLARDVSALTGLLRTGRIETVHAHFSHDHHVALLAALAAGKGRVIRSLELVRGARPGMARSVAFARTDGFAVPSAEHALALKTHHGIERTTILPGRVDSDRFSPGPSRLRDELGIPEGAPVVGIVSRMKPERLHLELIRAFASARTLVPSAWLTIVGRGEGEPLLRKAVAEAALTERVVFAGYRTGPDLVDAYRALDVKAWLAPGNDGTCRAVLEAMASGCSVLGGRFGAVAEAVVDGVTGRLVDPHHHEELALALAFLLQDRHRARSLGAAGRARALGVYTPSRRAAAVVALHENLLAAAQERPWPPWTPT